MGYRPSMPLAFPITNSSNPVAGGQGHCSKSQSGFPRVQLPPDKLIPADHSQGGTRKPQHLDEAPFPDLSLLIHEMGSQILSAFLTGLLGTQR